MRRSIIILYTLLCATAPVFADLGDLKDQMEKQEKGSTKQTTSSDSDSEEIDGDLLEAILAVWFWGNISCRYDSYPYARGPYVRYLFADEEEREGYTPWRFSVSEDIFWAHGEAIGSNATFEGKFLPLLGPRAGVLSLYDGDDWLHLVTLGGTLSLFQNSVLSTDVYIEWIGMRGLIEDSGVSWGAEFSSWPMAPVSLHAKVGRHAYRGGSSFDEWAAWLGLHCGRWEFDAGWRSLELRMGTYRLEGPFAGARFHF